MGTLPINARVIYTLYAVKQERAIEQTAMFAQNAEPGSDRDLVVLPEAMLAEPPRAPRRGRSGGSRASSRGSGGVGEGVAGWRW